MKRITALILCMVLFCLTPVSVFAEAGNSEDTPTLVDEADARTNIYYSVSSTSSQGIACSTLSVGSSYSTKDYNQYYATSTGKLVFRLAGVNSTSFTIYIYTESGGLHSSKTIDVSSTEASVEFSVTKNTYYYFKFENTGTRSSNLVGTVKGA